jgi:uncharacterized protein DUF3347
MVRRVLVLLAVFGVVVGVRAQGTGDLKVVLDSYLAIGDQLANDKVDGIKAPADAIAAEAAKMGEKGTALAKAAKAMGSPADLADARKAFGPLSDAVIEATKDARGDVKVAFCPMANASWLQKDATIRNPYYGSGMLTCGEFRAPK